MPNGRTGHRTADFQVEGAEEEEEPRRTSGCHTGVTGPRESARPEEKQASEHIKLVLPEREGGCPGPGHR